MRVFCLETGDKTPKPTDEIAGVFVTKEEGQLIVDALEEYMKNNKRKKKLGKVVEQLSKDLAVY